MSVSIVTACKNRTKALSISAASWVQFDEVDEVIVTDWNSDEPVNHLTRLSKKIKIITVKNERYFNQPQPLNLAASLVKTDEILKLDCDHVLNPYYNFFDLHKIGRDDFVSGCNGVDMRGMDAYFLCPIWGLLYVKSEIFKSVGGYDENFGKYYAVEDDELCMRLIAYGLNPRSIDIHKLSVLHIAHTDKDRVKNFKSFENINTVLTQSRKDLQGDILYNYMAELSRNKNKQDKSILHKMMQMFEEYETLGQLSEESLKMISNIDFYCEPVYKWKITQLSDQLYEAVKI